MKRLGFDSFPCPLSRSTVFPIISSSEGEAPKVFCSGKESEPVYNRHWQTRTFHWSPVIFGIPTWLLAQRFLHHQTQHFDHSSTQHLNPRFLLLLVQFLPRRAAILTTLLIRRPLPPTLKLPFDTVQFWCGASTCNVAGIAQRPKSAAAWTQVWIGDIWE